MRSVQTSQACVHIPGPSPSPACCPGPGGGDDVCARRSMTGLLPLSTWPGQLAVHTIATSSQTWSASSTCNSHQ
ncbi:hypothetical protein ElyMa_001144300 [Elysia marginata]|uniref:Uncharacterized protein n=1 Tax=Elysia marginata TaxID=1093978 RepID=A0AAV4HZT1_9GAST|nr:hypothetical protein ElyMa_001144300 [Elysia marginata]